MPRKLGYTPGFVKDTGVENIRVGRIPHVSANPVKRAIEHADEYASRMAKKIGLRTPGIKKPY